MLLLRAIVVLFALACNAFGEPRQTPVLLKLNEQFWDAHLSVDGGWATLTYSSPERSCAEVVFTRPLTFLLSANHLATFNSLSEDMLSKRQLFLTLHADEASRVVEVDSLVLISAR